MIQVEHFTKRYGKFTAVDDISFTVSRGEVFAFLGPNGSGKTTTMKAMVGLNLPTAGRILIEGIDVHRFPKQAKRLLSYLPQRVVFPENLTAREVVRFYDRVRRLPPALADQVLAGSNFNGFSDKTVSEFSGGMIQRLGLAVVTLPDAPVLLLDEPTANLDPVGVKRFREFVLEQKRRGKTIVFSTHLLAEAEQLADRVGIFVSGKLVAQESIESLRRTFLANGTIEDMYLHYVESHQREER
ncbi:MAG: ABC transporter ATP-binding protein [candidate division KSB1 bacterium]|nr:ABC transporter ATP-binding protein [candidate division KSB1 bacterium]MDZ7274212.1 ABC transporter ATP-binding protein [candidate division KSB1 bacterium]MDZ7287266.1 ABC transporter ATP-binding protein [candidate division KSB1 bacterium]MDZ7296810.1 ABC transporter ATP-binding protein [candidate division KSB1 bacterium]MDZ7308437.1 ABC transporter ATP-binding protein [candidate division KSB1 bacterium]